MVRGQAVAREHRALPQIFDELLRDDAVLIAGECGHIEQEDGTMKTQLRHIGRALAECGFEPAVIKAVERGGE